jgi:hypothetical protein
MQTGLAAVKIRTPTLTRTEDERTDALLTTRKKIVDDEAETIMTTLDLRHTMNDHPPRKNTLLQQKP